MLRLTRSFSTAEYARRVLWYSYRYLPMGLETSNSYWNTMWLGNIEGLTDLNQDYLGYSGVNKVYYAGNYNAGTEKFAKRHLHGYQDSFQ
ncbi:MAG: hypothetical protein ACLVL2_24355 [Bacteroides cellulosilyticus]